MSTSLSQRTVLSQCPLEAFPFNQSLNGYLESFDNVPRFDDSRPDSYEDEDDFDYDHIFLSNASHQEIVNISSDQESNILCLHESKYFTGLDLANACFHLKVAQNSKKYLCLNGSRSYISVELVHFGAVTTGQHFTLWVEKMYDKLPGHLQRDILFYLDGFSPTITLKQHLKAPFLI